MWRTHFACRVDTHVDAWCALLHHRQTRGLHGTPGQLLQLVALGAERHHVFRSVISMALGLIGAGTLLRFITNRVISNEVWTVTAFDPIALASAIAVVAVLGLVACSVPALRATRINPTTALRSE